MAVGEDLHLHMARLLQVAFEQHAVVAEGGLRLPPRAGQFVEEVRRGEDGAHALAAPAGARLDQHRETDARRLGGQAVLRLVLAVIARDDRHAGGDHQRLGFRLAAHDADRCGRRADEDDAGGRAGPGEIRVLREEAVAGVDRLGAGGARDLDDAVGTQVGIARGRGADRMRLIRQRDVQGVGIGLAEHGDAADAQALRRAHDAAGDLPAIGDEQAAEHHMRNTPKRVSLIGALSAALMARPSTSRVSAGSMMPSSHRRAVA